MGEGSADRSPPVVTSPTSAVSAPGTSEPSGSGLCPQADGTDRCAFGLGRTCLSPLVMKITFKNSFCLSTVTFPSLCASRYLGPMGCVASGLEHVHSAHHVLPADGTLAHALAALGAGNHVSALEQDTVDDSIHADTAQAVILLVLQLQPLAV